MPLPIMGTNIVRRTCRAASVVVPCGTITRMRRPLHHSHAHRSTAQHAYHWRYNAAAHTSASADMFCAARRPFLLSKHKHQHRESNGIFIILTAHGAKHRRGAAGCYHSSTTLAP